MKGCWAPYFGWKSRGSRDGKDLDFGRNCAGKNGLIDPCKDFVVLVANAAVNELPLDRWLDGLVRNVKKALSFLVSPETKHPK